MSGKLGAEKAGVTYTKLCKGTFKTTLKPVVLGASYRSFFILKFPQKKPLRLIRDVRFILYKKN